MGYLEQTNIELRKELLKKRFGLNVPFREILYSVYSILSLCFKIRVQVVYYIGVQISSLCGRKVQMITSFYKKL